MAIDAILIDDDPWVRSDWQEQGQRHSKTIMTVGSLDELSQALVSVGRDVPVFVDVELGATQSGLDVARQLASDGMTQIFLATAHASINIEALSFLKGIVGKEPPAWLLAGSKASKKLSQAERLVLLQGMSSEEKELLGKRLIDYENALYGLDGSLWLDGIGIQYPEDVLDCWERGIYEGCGDTELKRRIQAAWRDSLGV